MLQASGHELAWCDASGRTVLFPVSCWIRIGGRVATVTSVDVHEGEAEVLYDQGCVRLTMRLEEPPGAAGAVQRIAVEVREPLAGLLVDVQLEPRLVEPLAWLTLPALFYGDNDPGADRVRYPKGLDQEWSFRADAAACPGVHLPGESGGYAAFLESDRVGHAGPTRLRPGAGDVMGVGWAQGPTGGRRVRFTFPCQEEPRHYHRPDRLGRGLRPRLRARAGDTFQLAIHHFHTGPGRQAYFAPVRAMAARARPARLDAPEARERIRRTAALFAGCMRDSHFLPGIGFSHRQDLPEVHSGWSGGFAAVEAGLLYGAYAKDDRLRAQAEEMADFVCRTGVSPTGYFFAEYREGAWHPNVYWGKATGLHLRHASEGALFLARVLRREAAEGRVRPEWRRALYANLDAAVRDQRADGAFPIEVDPATGAPMDFEGVTPGAWMGSLAVGAALLRAEGDAARADRYAAAAARALDHYLERYLRADRFFGGPYDAWRAPNMEDPYNLLNASAELYRATQDPRALEAARLCADHLLSWRYAYDTVFPEGTVCAEQGVSTWGTAPASVRNRHLQNWDTVAAVALTELSGWTGDPAYAQAAVDHLVQSCQLVEQGDGALGIPRGGQSEQWYATEFRWFGSFGRYGKGNLWKVSVVLPKAGFLTAVALLGL